MGQCQQLGEHLGAPAVPLPHRAGVAAERGGHDQIGVIAADALRPDVEYSPQHASVYGALMLKGAVGAATLGDHTAVRDYLAECDRATALTGDRNDFWFAFGPTNVATCGRWPVRRRGVARITETASAMPRLTDQARRAITPP